MRLSVIVTTYNRPGALKKVLEALYAQTRLPDEILVADDGSGPETRAVLADFDSRPVPVLLHVWQEDQGFRAARVRNMAVAAASGDYLVFLDGDCIPDRCFVSDHLALAEPGCFFQGKRVLVDEKRSPAFDVTDCFSFTRRFCHALAGHLGNAHHVFRIPFFPGLKKGRGLSGIRSCNMGVFKADVRAVNGFNHDFEGWGREDSEFAVRLFKYGLVRKEHPFRAICYHLWHPENSRTSLSGNDRLLENALAADTHVCRNGLDSLENDRSSLGVTSTDKERESMAKLSVYIIAYNEADKIRDAILSVAWADEIVVADSFSTDATAAIAESLGARVVQIAFAGFGDLRNRAMAACTHDWIFSLDSDERCTPSAREEIRKIIADPDSQDAYYVPRRNYFMGKWIRYGGFYPDFRQPQLFRKGALVFMNDAVHERYEVISEKPCGTLTADIHQIPFKNLEEIIHKANRYSTLGAETLCAGRKRSSMWSALSHGVWAAFSLYVLKRGFLDGWAGFIIAFANFEGTYYKYAKFHLKKTGGFGGRDSGNTSRDGMS